MAELAQIVELAFPVAADGEDVDVVALYVIDLLAEVVFYDYLVGKACCPYCLHALKDVVAYVELSALAVEVVIGDTYNKVVAKFLRSA